MYQSNTEKVDDVLIAGDFNQDVSSERIQIFMRENGFVEVHETANNIKDKGKHNTCAKDLHK